MSSPNEPQARTARSVTAIVAAAGIPVGYKYFQTGHRTHDGEPITQPGVMISRQRRARYGGYEDAGAVFVYAVSPDHDPAVQARVARDAHAALVAAGLPSRLDPGSDTVEVLDDDTPAPAPVPEEPGAAQGKGPLLGATVVRLHYEVGPSGSAAEFAKRRDAIDYARHLNRTATAGEDSTPPTTEVSHIATLQQPNGTRDVAVVDRFTVLGTV